MQDNRLPIVVYGREILPMFESTVLRNKNGPKKDDYNFDWKCRYDHELEELHSHHRTAFRVVAGKHLWAGQDEGGNIILKLI